MAEYAESASSKGGEQRQPEASLIGEALRAELLRHIQDGALTAGKARAVARIADAAGRFLEQVSPSAGDGLAQLPGEAVGYAAMPASAGVGMPLLGYASPAIGQASLAGDNPAETMGARVIRELVTSMGDILRAIGKPKETVESLLYALVMARREGMPDVAAALEEKLLGRKLDGDRPVREPRLAIPVASRLDPFARPYPLPADECGTEHVVPEDDPSRRCINCGTVVEKEAST